MIEVKYTLERDMTNSEFNMLEELKSLQTPNNLLFFNETKKEKKKKEKKSRNRFTEIFSTDDEFLLEGELDKLKSDDDDDDINDSIINKQKKGYNKLKKNSDNTYKKEFAEELTLLYTLLSESNVFSKKLERKFDTIENAKTRNTSKYINDLINSIIMSKNSRLSILKEITNIKKIIADLKIKDNKVSDDKVNTMEHLASSYLKNIINYGRNNFIKNASFDEGDDDFSPNIEHTMFDTDMNEYEYGSVSRMIDERLEDDESNYRTSASNKIIEYEKLGVKILVRRNIDTGEWDFVAMDKLNRYVDDYPLPNKRNVTKMRFSDDGDYATDQFGRTYKVIDSYEFQG